LPESATSKRSIAATYSSFTAFSHRQKKKHDPRTAHNKLAVVAQFLKAHNIPGFAEERRLAKLRRTRARKRNEPEELE